MGVTETVYDLYEKHGVPGAIAEAGKMVEDAATAEDAEFYETVLDELLDMEEEG